MGYLGTANPRLILLDLKEYSTQFVVYPALLLGLENATEDTSIPEVTLAGSTF